MKLSVRKSLPPLAADFISLFCVAAQLCSKAMEVVTASKNLRAEMKSMIQTIYSNKTEAHHKIASATTDAMTEAKSRQVRIGLGPVILLPIF